MSKSESLAAVDPGPVKSGYVLMDGSTPVQWGHEVNSVLGARVRSWVDSVPGFIVAVEYMRPRGMPTSADEMDTMYELGRLTADVPVAQIAKVSRHEVKMALCGNTHAKDANIRAALIDRFGGEAVAIGGKKCRTCKGKGWVGRGRAACTDCHCDSGPEEYILMCGYETPPGSAARDI